MSTAEDVNKIREAVQEAALNAWVKAGKKGTIVMATGVGKSKIAAGLSHSVFLGSIYPGANDKVLIVVPTEVLRDTNWPDEFKKWGYEEALNQGTVKIICFASLPKEKGNRYKLVVMDEAHRITERSAEPFDGGGTGLISEVFADQEFAEQIMCLTATEPDPKTHQTKADILDAIAPVCFNYPIDQAVQDGIVSDYRIIVVSQPLETILREIKGGTAKSPFMQTEASAWIYLNKQTNKALAAARKNPAKKGWADAMVGKRARFIYDLPSKTRLAGKIMKKFLTPDKRMLVFCGSIEQSIKLCGEDVYNSKTNTDALDAFKEGKTNKCGVVRAVNEGVNLPDQDYSLVVQVSANPRELVQRLGRSIRWRPGNHVAYMWIICSETEVDKRWVREAISLFDPAKISYDSYMNYL